MPNIYLLFLVNALILCSYVGFAWKRKVSSKACLFGRFDLIIVALPKGLPMPNVSSFPTNISSWNVHKSKNIEALFGSTFSYLTNNGHLHLFVHEKKDV